jgi:hypothetical protein
MTTTFDEPSQVANPEKIAALANDLSRQMQRAVKQINDLNVQSRFLSFNAQIEAARSGVAGTTFAVVALEMRELSDSTARIADSVSQETGTAIAELQQISTELATNVRGNRLRDLALVNIDLIDRNLYERSCDCRWWATDASLVEALTQRTPAAYQYAAQRMNIILKAYTVYFDLVLADAQGTIVANGRSDQYRSQGSNQWNSAWFQSAMKTASGEEFGFESVHESSLVAGERVLIYSAGIRENGDLNGKLLGVLGIVFRWDALAQAIVENTPMSQLEKSQSRVCIVDSSGLILADTEGRQLQEHLDLAQFASIIKSAKHFSTVNVNNEPCCVAHARSPGFETYATGWHSLIIQRLPN